MAALTPITVHVEKPVGVYFSECFAEMRIWLTAHKITPVDFRLSGGYSSIGLDIAFSNFEEADLFEREFAHKNPGPSVAVGAASDYCER